MHTAPLGRRTAVCTAVLALMLFLLPVVGKAQSAAEDIQSYLTGDSAEPLVLTGQGDLVLSFVTIDISGHKSLVIPEGMTLVVHDRSLFAVPKDGSLTLSGEGDVVIGGSGQIINRELFAVHCNLLIEEAGLVENYSMGSPGRMRIGEGGTVTVDIAKSTSGILCNSVNYNASVSVEDGGRLIVQNAAETGVQCADLNAEFASATLRVCKGGQLILCGMGGTLIDGQKAGGQFLSLEAGGTAVVAAANPFGNLIQGSAEGIAYDPDTRIVYLVEDKLPLPDSAPQALYGVRLTVTDDKKQPAAEYTLTGQWTGEPVYYNGEAYYPFIPGETVTLSAPDRLDAEYNIDPELVPGEDFTLQLGPGAPTGPQINPLHLILIVIAGAAAFVLYGKMRNQNAEVTEM